MTYRATRLGIIGVIVLAPAIIGAATQEAEETAEQSRPNVVVDFSKPLGDPTEERFAAALDYRNGLDCPAATGAAPGALSKGTVLEEPGLAIEPESPLRTNRIILP